MGDWKSTCQISHLPIKEDDEIVVIPVCNNKYSMRIGMYTTDIYAPITTPIYGKYDGYGSIYDYQILDKARDFLLSQEYIIDKKIKKFNTLDDLFDIINRRPEIIINSSSYDFKFFICHRKIFDDIINDVGKRTAYRNLIFDETIEKFLKSFFDKKHQEYEEVKDNEIKTLNFKCKIGDILDEMHWFDSPVGCGGFCWFIMDIICNKATDNDIQELLKLRIFEEGLSLGRMGYFSPSLGSEEDEYYIQNLVAKFIIEKTNEEYKKYCEEEDEEEDEADKMSFEKSSVDLYWYHE